MRHLIYFILLLIPFWTNAQLVETVVQDIVSESVTSLVGTTIVNLVINSGASGTTDWVDTNTDGIADDWVQATGAGAPTIVTGNGFLGNAQRVNHVTGTQTLFRQLTGVNTIMGETYQATFKYRTNDANTRLYLRGGSDALILGIPLNVGDAVEVQYTVVATAATQIIFNFTFLPGRPNYYFEMDEILLWKVE